MITMRNMNILETLVSFQSTVEEANLTSYHFCSLHKINIMESQSEAKSLHLPTGMSQQRPCPAPPCPMQLKVLSDIPAHTEKYSIHHIIPPTTLRSAMLKNVLIMCSSTSRKMSYEYFLHEIGFYEMQHP
jgi:hypothetical protein